MAERKPLPVLKPAKETSKAKTTAKKKTPTPRTVHKTSPVLPKAVTEKPKSPMEAKPVSKTKQMALEEFYDNGSCVCTCCGKEYKHRKGNFLKSTSPLYAGTGGYVSICRDCTLNYYSTVEEYYEFDARKTIERMCQLFDCYYSPDVVEATSINAVNMRYKHRWPFYLTKCNFVKNLGIQYLDTLKEREDNQQRIHSMSDLPKESDLEEEEYDENETPTISSFVVTKEMVRKFGIGMNGDEYEFLEEEYKDWCSKVEVKSKAQEELIKNICLSQLNIRRAQASNNAKAVQEAQKNFTELLQNCNLTPKQANEVANSSVAQMSLGNLIKKIENEEPIKTPTKEFQDPDGIRRYLSGFFFGHLAKALKIKNDNQQLYDELIGDYSVNMSDVDDDVNDINGLLDETGEEDD